MRKLILLVFALIVSNFSFGLSSPIQQKFDLAIELYKNSRFEEAANLLEELKDSNLVSSNLYFNLGNCYYRLEQTGLAILNYEKAAKLNPKDADVQFNLEHANKKLVDKTDAKAEFVSTFGNANYSTLNSFLNGLNYFAVILFLIGLVMSILFFIQRKNKSKVLFRGSIVSLILGVVLSLSVYLLLDLIKTPNEAIVLNKSVYVKTEPNSASKDLFILHEGTKVRLENASNEYVKITLADGKSGWCLQSELGNI